MISLVPAVAVIAALRYPRVRHLLNRTLARLIALARRLIHRPAPGAEDALDRFFERVASIRLPQIAYVEVFLMHRRDPRRPGRD